MPVIVSNFSRIFHQSQRADKMKAQKVRKKFFFFVVKLLASRAHVRLFINDSNWFNKALSEVLGIK